MEQLNTELLLVILGAFSTAFGVVVRWVVRRINTLQEAQDARHKADLAAANKARDAQAEKVTALEKQMVTICRELEDVRERLEAAEKREQNKQAENDRLTKENKRIEQQNVDLFDANKTLMIENSALKNALALVGIERAERESLESKPAPVELGAGETEPIEGV